MSNSVQINDHFQRDTQVACKKAIEQFRQAHPTADLCGFALYSDADARTLVPSFNTEPSVANTSTPCRACCGTWLIRFPMKILHVTVHSSSNTVLQP
ncbi:DUF4303 domain-containing protein [Pseudomonas sp. PB101]|jgi:hypothetical protein|nr:DUF4303 domain-containing protein [Pseudomonas sp. PB101]